MVEHLSDAGLAVDPATTLGAGGMFIVTDSALAQGTPLKLRFRLPGGERIHEISGRVAWTRRPCESGRFAPGMGVEFTDREAAVPLARELERLR